MSNAASGAIAPELFKDSPWYFRQQQRAKRTRTLTVLSAVDVVVVVAALVLLAVLRKRRRTGNGETGCVCPNCGTRLSQENKFCSGCGQSVHKEEKI